MCCTVEYCGVLYCGAVHYTIQCCTGQYMSVQNSSTILHSTVQIQ